MTNSNTTTKANLETIVARINRMTGSPETEYTRKDGKLISNVGNFHLDSAYGGYSLSRNSETGGETDIFRVGHVSKSELKKLLFAFIDGLYMAETLKTSKINS